MDISQRLARVQEALAADADLFRHIADRTLLLAPALRIFRESVAYGIKQTDDAYEFLDPGISMRTLQELPDIRRSSRRGNLLWPDGDRRFYFQPWYQRGARPRVRTIRPIVAETYEKKYEAQKKLLPHGERVCPAAILVRFWSVFLTVHDGRAEHPFFPYEGSRTSTYDGCCGQVTIHCNGDQTDIREDEAAEGDSYCICIASLRTN